MLDLPINLNDEKNIISGYNFAKNSDVIFSEILTHKQYSKILDKTKLSKVFENKDLVSYVNRDFTIKENDIIFTTTHFVEDLFTELKNLKNLKNIKLILFEHHYDDMIEKGYKFSDINSLLIKNNFKQIFKKKMPFRKTFEYIYINKAY